MGRRERRRNWKHWRTITREQYNRFVCHKSNFMIITAEARSYSAGLYARARERESERAERERDRCAIRHHKNGRLPPDGRARPGQGRPWFGLGFGLRVGIGIGASASCTNCCCLSSCLSLFLLPSPTFPYSSCCCYSCCCCCRPTTRTRQYF